MFVATTVSSKHSARYHETLSRDIFPQRIRPGETQPEQIPGDDTPLIKSLRQSWYGVHRRNPSHNLVWNFLISFIFVFADWDFASQFVIRVAVAEKLYY